MIKKDKETVLFLKRKTLHDLILFCLFKVTESKERATIERLVAECFLLFPNSFELKGYPKWPDSKKLDRALRSLRKNKLINGGSKTFFTLTKKGKQEVENMLKELRQKKLL
jgi:hypothetical protein